MNKDNGRSFWEYPSNPDLGIRKGSASDNFVPADWMNTKASKLLDVGVKVIRQVEDMTVSVIGKASEVVGSIRVRGRSGKVYENASTD